jgi:hypothetical protein
MMIVLLTGFFGFTGCENPVMSSSYKVILPEIPIDWENVLGKPVWKIEWVDKNGNWQKIDVQENRNFSLEICNTKLNPVIAYPFWPEKNIAPKIFFPAGAIFPLDVHNNRINLDWQAGIDAQLYLYLSKYNNGGTRNPDQFDWLRFRTLLRTEMENAEIIANPWIVDWENAAKKIAASGFRSSYIKAAKYTEISATIPESALWISPSPFETGKKWETGETIVLNASETPSRFISAKGTIVFTDKTWDYFPRKE